MTIILPALPPIVSSNESQHRQQLAQAITQLAKGPIVNIDARVDNANASVVAEATARASADSAEASLRSAADATLQTNINTVSASVTTETTARVNGDSAEATARIAADSTLTTAYNNVSASGLFKIATATTASGADASISMQVSATSGGTHSDAGIFLDAVTGGGSRVRITANQIELDGTVLTSGGIVNSMIGSAAVDGGKIASASVGASHIIDGSATTHASTTWSSVTSAADNAAHQLGTITVTTVGKPVEINVACDYDSTASGVKSISFLLQRGGTTLRTWPTNTSHGITVDGGAGDAKTFSYTDTGASAGSNTYAFYYQWITTGGNGQLTLDGQMVVDEIVK